MDDNIWWEIYECPTTNFITVQTPALHSVSFFLSFSSLFIFATATIPFLFFLLLSGLRKVGLGLGPYILFSTCHFKSPRFDLNDVRFVCKYIFGCCDRHTHTMWERWWRWWRRGYVSEKEICNWKKAKPHKLMCMCVCVVECVQTGNPYLALGRTCCRNIQVTLNTNPGVCLSK